MAAQDEFDALICNGTWTLVLLPPGRKAISCKWLFKIKRNPDDAVARRKGRLVAKGCSVDQSSSLSTFGSFSLHQPRMKFNPIFLLEQK